MNKKEEGKIYWKIGERVLFKPPVNKICLIKDTTCYVEKNKSHYVTLIVEKTGEIIYSAHDENLIKLDKKPMKKLIAQNRMQMSKSFLQLRQFILSVKRREKSIIIGKDYVVMSSEMYEELNKKCENEIFTANDTSYVVRNGYKVAIAWCDDCSHKIVLTKELVEALLKSFNKKK